MYKNGVGINNLQWLMGHKTEPNQWVIALTTKLLPIMTSSYNDLNCFGLVAEK